MSGTSGESKRLEAIEISLSGEIANYFDVWYRVHAQTYGWMAWAKNGERAGTSSMAKRLEGIQIVLVAKGGTAPTATYQGISQQYARPYASPLVTYRTHVQTYGWQSYVYDGQTSGTTGQSKRLEGIEIKLPESQYSGSIEYRTHVQTYGWQSWVIDGTMSGTSGQSKRLEAIQIQLTGDIANYYDVWYRVHAQSFGWMGWAQNGEQAGTEGFAYRLEGIQIVLLDKGSAAPGSTENAFRKYDGPSVIRGKRSNWSIEIPDYWKGKVDIYQEESYYGSSVLSDMKCDWAVIMPKGYAFDKNNLSQGKFLATIYIGKCYDGYFIQRRRKHAFREFKDRSNCNVIP